jgi:dTDP-4-amino-4,6-dideoxygalactose transaminase
MSLETSLRIFQTSPLANYQAHAAEIDAAIRRVLESGRYLSGAETESFENEFAEFIGAKTVVAVSNGTDALWLAFAGCGVGRGDEVLTVSHTAVATVAAIELSGATPVFVDIDPQTLTLDPQLLEAARSERTRAVVPVHLYGQPADLDPMVDFCRRHHLRLIEDCAQAAGALYRGKRVGNFGNAAAFSFYPTKNLSAIGDAGMVVTNSSGLAEKMRGLRQYGWRNEQRVSEYPGCNARMDELQGAILRAKLPYLDRENSRRQELAVLYNKSLAGLADITLPVEPAFGRSVFHQYVIRSQRRDALAKFLRARGIATAIHYPTPVHAQPAYRSRQLAASAPGKSETLPETMRAAREILSLPMYPELSSAAVQEVSEAIRSFVQSENATR